MPLHCPSKENKIKETKSKIRKIKENKIKIVSVQMSHNNQDILLQTISISCS